ncbi:MAG TPA: hypothetical protein VIX85_04895 [Acidimicrobiales bacterium]
MTGHAVSLGIWALMAVLLVGLGIASLASDGRVARVGSVGRLLTGGRLRGAVFLAAWMWLGWHFFAR